MAYYPAEVEARRGSGSRHSNLPDHRHNDRSDYGGGREYTRGRNADFQDQRKKFSGPPRDRHDNNSEGHSSYFDSSPSYPNAKGHHRDDNNRSNYYNQEHNQQYDMRHRSSREASRHAPMGGRLTSNNSCQDRNYGDRGGGREDSHDGRRHNTKDDREYNSRDGRGNNNDNGRYELRDDRGNNNDNGRYEPRDDRGNNNDNRRYAPRDDRENNNDNRRYAPRDDRENNNDNGRYAPRDDRENNKDNRRYAPRDDRGNNNDNGRYAPRGDRGNNNDNGRYELRDARGNNNDNRRYEPRDDRGNNNDNGRYNFRDDQGNNNDSRGFNLRPRDNNDGRRSSRMEVNRDRGDEGHGWKSQNRGGHSREPEERGSKGGDRDIDEQSPETTSPESDQWISNQNQNPERKISNFNEAPYYAEDSMNALFEKLSEMRVNEDGSLTTFLKDFYEEHPAVANMSRADVENERKRRQITIIYPKDLSLVPNPVLSFELSAFPVALTNVFSKKQFAAPTPIQVQGWPIALKGHDLIGVAQTGSGKTLAYILPGIVHAVCQPKIERDTGPIVLVIAPTRELASQIGSETKDFADAVDFKVATIYGQMPDMYRTISLIKSGVHILIACPGKLMDFLQKRILTLKRTTYFVLDEADKLLEMGFKPQIEAINRMIRPDRQVLMWSATWPAEVQRLVQRVFPREERPFHLQIGATGATVDAIQQYFVQYNDDAERDKHFINHMRSTANQMTLVFCNSKSNVDYLVKLLPKETNQMVQPAQIHGGLDQPSRMKNLEMFRNKLKNCLVATEVAARGLDVPLILQVINYDCPDTLTDYIHRVGRTGRVAASGHSHTYISSHDFRRNTDFLKQIPNLLVKNKHDVPGWLGALSQDAGGSYYQSRQRYDVSDAEDRNEDDHYEQRAGGKAWATTNQPSSPQDWNNQSRATGNREVPFNNRGQNYDSGRNIPQHNNSWDQQSESFNNRNNFNDNNRNNSTRPQNHDGNYGSQFKNETIPRKDTDHSTPENHNRTNDYKDSSHWDHDVRNSFGSGSNKSSRPNERDRPHERSRGRDDRGRGDDFRDRPLLNKWEGESSNFAVSDEAVNNPSFFWADAENQGEEDQKSQEEFDEWAPPRAVSKIESDVSNSIQDEDNDLRRDVQDENEANLENSDLSPESLNMKSDD